MGLKQSPTVAMPQRPIVSHRSVVLHLECDEVDSLVIDCFTQYAVILLISGSLHLMSAV